METVSDFIFSGSKITVDGDSSHEIKRHLLLGRKAMTNLDSMLKSRDITLPTKVYLVKAMVFPAVMHGCESWTIKRAERPRIDAFELWCWRRLLRVPWTTRRSSQSILKEISPGCSLEGLMLKLEILCPPHVKSWLIGKDSEWTLGVGDGQGGLACCNSWGRKESDTTEPLNWTELNWWVTSSNSAKWCSITIEPIKILQVLKI